MDIFDFYRLVDALIKKWEEEGQSKYATRLSEAKISGATSGEVLGEIALVLKDFYSEFPGSVNDASLVQLQSFLDNSLV